MRFAVTAIVLCGSLTWSATAAAAETWDCHIKADASRPGSVDYDVTIIVNGAEARLLRDPAMTLVVDRNDDQTLVASFADYGGKPPIRTTITVVKSSGDYSEVVTGLDRILGSVTGHCVKN